MNTTAESYTPVITRDGLLRLVELVDRMRARQVEGESSWTRKATGAPESGPREGGRGDVDAAAGADPADGGGVAGDAGCPEAGDDDGRRACGEGDGGTGRGE
jgi:hypothetical protein